jgi:hypothetical protein
VDEVRKHVGEQNSSWTRTIVLVDEVDQARPEGSMQVDELALHAHEPCDLSGNAAFPAHERRALAREVRVLVQEVLALVRQARPGQRELPAHARQVRAFHGKDGDLPIERRVLVRVEVPAVVERYCVL